MSVKWIQPQNKYLSEFMENRLTSEVRRVAKLIESFGVLECSSETAKDWEGLH